MHVIMDSNHDSFYMERVFKMENVNVKYIALPATVKSYVVANPDGTYTIILNSNLNYEQNMKSYIHELQHIENGDCDKKCSADWIEITAHSA